MPKLLRATDVRPENSVLVYSLDLKKNRTVLWGMNLGSLVLVFIFGGLFLEVVRLVRPEFMAQGISFSFNPIYVVISLFGTFAILIVVHEFIHGVFFWIYTRRRPRFGLRGWYAFASAPGWYFPRRQYLVIGLAPFVVLSVLGMLLLAVLPVAAIALTLFAVTLNAASSVGDLWVCLRLTLHRGPIAVEDVGDGMYFYALS
jgi:hypothetical protein